VARTHRAELAQENRSQLVADLVGAIVLLLGMQARPVAKAALGFVKAALSSLPPASLEPHLPGIVQGIMGWLSTTDSQVPAQAHALTRGHVTSTQCHVSC
jgi:hypothetical protein